MKRCFRLRTRREFEEVYRRGRSRANEAAVLYSVRKGEGATRLGVAAGRKLGSAVVRNRVKRRLREAVRRLWPEVPSGYLLVLIGRAGARDMPFSELCGAVRELFRRSGVLKGPPGGGSGTRPGPEAGQAPRRG